MDHEMQFPPLTQERLAEIIDQNEETASQFPGGISWQIIWLAREIQASWEEIDTIRWENNL